MLASTKLLDHFKLAKLGLLKPEYVTFIFPIADLKAKFVVPLAGMITIG